MNRRSFLRYGGQAAALAPFWSAVPAVTERSRLDAAPQTVPPGVPPGEREKLFMPYYSTKGRGSGLGLAIVRRIVAEHGGSIEVGDNTPRGSRFVIELPC